MPRRAPPSPSELTARERQVLERVCLGHQTKEIARALSLSPRTVELYRSNLLRKTGSRSAGDLVRKMLLADSGAPLIR
jgi:DNA-binding NarL/FixJ family response regulator